MEIVLATTNLHKIREFKEMFRPLKFVDLLTLHQFPDYVPPEETGVTFEENSTLKAIHAGKTLKRWVIADDSGLCVSVLNNAPGVYSKGYAGETASDKENRIKLLKELSGIPFYQRSAFYQCTIALANEKGLKKCVTGTIEGMIVEEEKGREGFGYDSLFQPLDSFKTFGELPPEIKNKISHRRKAFEKLLSTLESLK